MMSHVATMSNPPETITIAALAKLTGISRRTLARMAKSGRLPAFRPKGARTWRVWMTGDLFEQSFESTELQPEQPAEVNT